MLNEIIESKVKYDEPLKEFLKDIAFELLAYFRYIWLK